MLFRAMQVLRRQWFNIHCSDICTTPPIAGRGTNVRILSMVSHRDLIMYLVAIKSLLVRLGMGQVVVINDGTLSSKDLELLRGHLPSLGVVPIQEIDVGKCPSGGTWERLLLIADYVADNYVIQVDSDTLTLRDIPEVLAAIDENRSFTLGTGMGRRIAPMREICEQMKAFSGGYVQVAAERNFDRLRRVDEMRYVRGCSGFAGFARGSFRRSEVEEFSREMEQILGETWFDWGSEQVTSNAIVANSPRAHVLPYPKYCNFTPEVSWEESSFLHFIGTYRFTSGVYRKRAREVVKRLGQASWERTADLR